MYLPRAFVEHIHLSEKDERDRTSNIADIQRLIVTIQDKDFLVHGAQASPNKKKPRPTQSQRGLRVKILYSQCWKC